MEKRCRCGGWMVLTIRNVVYQGSVEIENVPVLTCERCERSEIAEAVKDDLKKLLDDLSCAAVPGKVNFEEVSEWAHVLVQYAENAHVPLRDMLGERIDDLLDLYLLAKTLNDEDWMREIQGRLKQVI